MRAFLLSSAIFSSRQTPTLQPARSRAWLPGSLAAWLPGCARLVLQATRSEYSGTAGHTACSAGGCQPKSFQNATGVIIIHNSKALPPSQTKRTKHTYRGYSYSLQVPAEAASMTNPSEHPTTYYLLPMISIGYLTRYCS